MPVPCGYSVSAEFTTIDGSPWTVVEPNCQSVAEARRAAASAPPIAHFGRHRGPTPARGGAGRPVEGPVEVGPDPAPGEQAGQHAGWTDRAPGRILMRR